MQPTESFAPTVEQQNYLQEKLQLVSRSFALVVPFLELPLRHYLAAAYLLCRVVDNIEDSGQDDEWKIERFGEFSRLLGEPEQAAGVLANWERAEWHALTGAERSMMGVAEGLPLWQIFAAMPAATRATCRLWIGIMTEGMKQLSDSARAPSMIQRNGRRILESREAYNRYCYYVAGTVGHLVTELVILHYPLSAETASELRTRAEACGRALQKTNIVKDFYEDIERGVSYLPDTWLAQADYRPLALRGAPSEWTEMVLTDVLDELQVATEYLVALPYSAEGYRRAALLCLLPAYQTMRAAAQQQDLLFTRKHFVKISHAAMAQCLADSEAMLHDNGLLEQYSRQITDEIHNQFNVPVMVPGT